MSAGLLSAAVQVVLPTTAAPSTASLLVAGATVPKLPSPVAISPAPPRAVASASLHPRSAPAALPLPAAAALAVFNDPVLHGAAPSQPLPAAMSGAPLAVAAPPAVSTTAAPPAPAAAGGQPPATAGSAAVAAQRPQWAEPKRKLADIRPPKRPRMLMIVNSNVRYWKPFQTLMNSLVKVGFDRWRDVIVVFGGSTRDISPYAAPADAAPAGVLFVNLTLDNFDLNGLSALYKYRSNACLHADSYFYIHDSTEAGEGFPRSWSRLSVGIGFLEVRVPKSPSSNIMVFGSGLVSKYKENFDVNMTKWEGIRLEGVNATGVVRGVRPLAYFAENITRMVERKIRGEIDIYGTGIKRKVVWYSEFNLYKYILWARFGDIGEDGNVQRVDAQGQKPRR